LFPAPPSAAQEDAQPDPRLRGEPWTVDLMPSIRGSITLIGYDRLGDVMAELRIPKRCYKPGMAARLERWIRENDDTPPNLTVL
jgi:hypothetical protein